MTLSARISAASVEQTREMLKEAFKFIHLPSPGPAGWIRDIPRKVKWDRFMDADAYHDASMMLTDQQEPVVRLSQLNNGAWVVTTPNLFEGKGYSIPLAIAAAAVKVKESE